MTEPPREMTDGQAAAVLAAALSAPGSGEAVLGSFADLPGTTFTPARRGGLLHRATPASLAVGQWSFEVVEPGGTRLGVQHVVHGVSLRSEVVGPAHAAETLASALLADARECGPHVVDALQAILYGMAVVGGAGDLA